MASPITATPLPLYTAIPDVPADLAAAVNNVEKFAVARFATAGARDTAIPTPIDGMVCYVTGTGFLKNVGGTTGGWTALIPVVTIPDEVASVNNVSFTITGAGGALLALSVAASITNPSSTQALLVAVPYGGQIVANGAASRITTAATGSNVWAGNVASIPSGDPKDGPIGYSESFIEVQQEAVSVGRTMETGYSFRIPAGGTTTITLYAWKSATGTSNVINNCKLRMVPIRYV
jgi:hypothetical protein